MRKIICLLLSLAVSCSAIFAQTKDAKKTAATKPATTKTAAKPAAETKSAAKTKKDGTPDKRFKENKTAAKPAGPTKKDGTPDMRYKANKTTAPKK